MDSIQLIDLKKSILENNDEDADRLRQELKEDGTFYINVMSSPGSGKTTTLVRTIDELKEKFDVKIGVMEADIDSDVDARTILEKCQVPAVQLHTGGMCHLDADMSRQGLRAVGGKELDVVFLENVGNLVCPAEFDTGAHLNVAILSVTEGDEKPLKYPLMFEQCEVVLINKMDAISLFDFNVDAARAGILKRNPNAAIFPISAKTGEGFAEWTDWLGERMQTK